MMQGAAKDTLGMVMIGLGACMITIIVVLTRVMQDWDWPCFRFNGLVAAISFFGISLFLWLRQGWQGLTCPMAAAWWVLGRGICGTVQFALTIAAVLVGLPVGDANALSSINVVVAALCGRLF